MIAYIEGKVVEYSDTKVIVKVTSGLGYELLYNPKDEIAKNQELELFVWEVAKDNAVELYSFASSRERDWAMKMHKVPGVGPKTATNIIYHFGIERLSQIIFSGDYKELTTMKGLGAKGAKKIILELKSEKIDANVLAGNTNNPNIINSNNKTSLDFSDSLKNLGYKSSDIVRVITLLKRDGLWDEEDLVGTVKAGLKYLSK